MEIPERIADLLKRERSFTITSHENPEGDALGSSIALALGLEKMGKGARVFNKDGVPGIYGFLPRADLVETELDAGWLKGSVLVVLDCNELNRVGIEAVDCRSILVIDHHLKEPGEAPASRPPVLSWIEPSSPATGLMVYRLLGRLGVEIDAEMATNLYTAIAVDTGTFRYDNTTAEVLRAAADLVDAGAVPGELSRRLYESWTVNRFRLLIEMLNTLEIRPGRDGGPTVAITTVTEEMFRKTGTDASQTENFSNFPRMIRSVDISVMFRQIGPRHWKASLRSKGAFDVAAVASLFQGGGHRNAAGYKVHGEIEEVKERLLEAVRGWSGGGHI